MGWLTLHRPRGLTDKEFFQGQMGSSYKVLETGRDGRTAYLAVEHPEGYVFGMVCLLHLAPRSDYNFGYKDMDESMGPNEDRCPEKVLNLLSPLDEFPHSNDYAADWRKRCEANLAAKKALPKVKKGDTIILEEPVTLTDGREVKEFVFDGKFRAKFGEYGLMRLPRDWKRRFKFTVA